MTAEMKRCVGIGWVTFDRSGETQASPPNVGAAASADSSTSDESVAEQMRAPQLLCAGYRFSQALQPGSRRPREHVATSLDGIGREQAKSHNEIPAETWAMLCAGQLSMIVPPGAPTAGPSTSAQDPSEAVGGVLNSPWTTCRVRCNGFSLRLDSVSEDSEHVNTPHAALRPSSEAAATSSRTVNDGNSQSNAEDVPGGLQNTSEDWSQTIFRGTEAIVGRASLIATSLKGAASEAGPRHVVTNTPDAASKICWQAFRIVKRSGEQVGQLATLPLRIFGGGSSEDSQG